MRELGLQDPNGYFSTFTDPAAGQSSYPSP